MTLKRYKLIKALYDGIVSVEYKGSEFYKVGDIYRFNENIMGIIKEIKSTPQYIGCNYFLTIELI